MGLVQIDVATKLKINKKESNFTTTDWLFSKLPTWMQPLDVLCVRYHPVIVIKIAFSWNCFGHWLTQQCLLTSSWKQVSVSSSGVRKDDENTSVSSCVAKPDKSSQVTTCHRHHKVNGI